MCRQTSRGGTLSLPMNHALSKQPQDASSASAHSNPMKTRGIWGGTGSLPYEVPQNAKRAQYGSGHPPEAPYGCYVPVLTRFEVWCRPVPYGALICTVCQRCAGVSSSVAAASPRKAPWCCRQKALRMCRQTLYRKFAFLSSHSRQSASKKASDGPPRTHRSPCLPQHRC